MVKKHQSGGSKAPRRSMRLPLIVLAAGVASVLIGLWRPWSAPSVRRAASPLAQPGTPTADGRPSALADAVTAVSATILPAGTIPGEPPFPHNLDTLEGAIARRMRDLLDAVHEQPGDAETRGQLGIFYEAHAYDAFALECYADAFSANPAIPRWRYHWAVVAQQAGDLQGAEEALLEVVERRPDYAPAHERLGLILLDRGAFDEAAERFTRVMELRPKQPPAYLGLARVHLEQRQYGEAAEWLNKAVPLAPGYTVTHYLLGQAYRGLGLTDKAEAALARGGRSQWVYTSDPWRDDIIRVVVTRSGKLRFAKSLVNAGRLTEAVEIMDELLASGTVDVETSNTLARIYMGRRQYQDARRVLEQTARAVPESGSTHANLALVLVALGDLEAALRQATEAVRLDSTAAECHFSKGTVLERLGRTSEAVVAFQEAASLDPWSAKNYRGLGRMLMQEKRWTKAAETWEKASDLQPKFWFNFYNLGRAYGHLGRSDDAARAFAAALELSPDNEQVKRALGGVAEQRPGE